MTAPLNTKREPPYKLAGLVMKLLTIAAVVLVVLVYLQFRGDFLSRTQLILLSAHANLAARPRLE
jgi:phospholipid/cholesterol/gamma-HCH transport system substrate-binding protein